MEWTISVNVSRRNGKESWGWEIRSWDELGFEYSVDGGAEASAELIMEDVASVLRTSFNGE